MKAYCKFGTLWSWLFFLLQAVSSFLQVGYSLTTSGEGGYGKCHSCRHQSGDKSPGWPHFFSGTAFSRTSNNIVRSESWMLNIGLLNSRDQKLQRDLKRHWGPRPPPFAMLQCEDIVQVENSLRERNIKSTRRVVEEGGIMVDQLFFHDPDGFMIEICNCEKLPVEPLATSAAVTAATCSSLRRCSSLIKPVTTIIPMGYWHIHPTPSSRLQN